MGRLDQLDLSAQLDRDEYEERLLAAQRKLLDNLLRDFRLAGVALPPGGKQRYRELMQQLAKAQSRFDENVLDSTQAWTRRVRDEAELAGMPDGAIARAAAAALSRGLDGWLITLDEPNYVAVMSHAENVSLRRDFYEAWTTRASDRGPSAGRFDNSTLMEHILALRHETATLLGLSSYAELSLATKMAAGPDEVLGFLRSQKLEDLCISRPLSRLSWGIPLPFDERLGLILGSDQLSKLEVGDRPQFELASTNLAPLQPTKMADGAPIDSDGIPFACHDLFPDGGIDLSFRILHQTPAPPQETAAHPGKVDKQALLGAATIGPAATRPGC